MRKRIGGVDRAILYDAKQELYPQLIATGVPAADVSILNPFDRRGVAWDLAEDFTSSSEAIQLAKTIIPAGENLSQPYFANAAAEILAAVISVFMRKQPGQWDLANIVKSAINLSNVKAKFAEDEQNILVDSARNHLAEATTANNVMAEVSSRLYKLLPVAACWRKTDPRASFSIKRFIQTPGKICILGANQSHSEALSTLNRLFIKRFSEIVLDHHEDGQWQAQNRTWLFLDEVRELGRIEGLANLVNKGRSKGVCAVLGFQDYAGLKQAFGEHAAHELTASCHQKLFLKLGTESAEWASRSIGKCEIQEVTISRTSNSSISLNASTTEGTNWSNTRGLFSSSSSGGGHGGINSGGRNFGSSQGGMESRTNGINITFGQSITANTTIRETDAVQASEIAHLPGFEEGNGLHGFVCQNSSNATDAGDKGLAQVHRVFIPGGFLVPGEVPPGNPGFMPRPASDQEMG